MLQQDKNTLSNALAGGDAGEPAKRLAWSRIVSGLENRVVCIAELVVEADAENEVKAVLRIQGWDLFHSEKLNSDQVALYLPEHEHLGSPRLLRLYAKRVIRVGSRTEIDLLCHDEIVVALGRQGQRILSLTVERRMPRAGALSRGIPKVARMVDAGGQPDAVVFRMERTTIFASKGLEQGVWNEYRDRHGLPKVDIDDEKPHTITPARIAWMVILLLLLAVAFAVGFFTSTAGENPSWNIFTDRLTVWWATGLFFTSALITVACLVASLVFVIIPIGPVMRSRSTIAARWDFLMLSTDDRLKELLPVWVARLRSTIQWALTISLAIAGGILFGGKASDLRGWWFGIGAAVALFALAGLWTALRRIVRPSLGWLTLGGVIAAGLLLVTLYSRLTVEHFYDVIGVPSFSIEPAAGQLVASNYKFVLLAVGFAALSVALWLTARGHISPPLSWMCATILIFLPAFVLAIGYDTAGASGLRVLYVSDYNADDAWVGMSSVCLQSLASASNIEVGEGKVLDPSVSVEGLRVGLADGRIFYLVPRTIASDGEPRYGLVSVPATAVVERDIAIGNGGCY